MNASTLLLLLLVLACPVSMFFMHRGGGHAHGSDSQQNQATGQKLPETDIESENGHGGCGHAAHGAGSRHDHSKSGTPA